MASSLESNLEGSITSSYVVNSSARDFASSLKSTTNPSFILKEE